MNQIYICAALTLVTLDAEDVAAGLDGVRPYLETRSRPTTEMQGLQFTMISSPLPLILDSSKWTTRAWTFGEDQFSRRMMFFTK